MKTQLTRQQLFVIFLTMMILHTAIGALIVVIFGPTLSTDNFIRSIVIFGIISFLSYGLLSLLFRFVPNQQVSDSVRALSNALPDRAIVMDEDGLYIDVINRYQHTGVYQPYGVIGKSVTDIYDDDFGAFVMSTLQDVLESNEPRIMEYANTNINGELIHYEGRIVPFIDAKTQKRCVVWTSRDITERIEAEQMRVELAIERKKVIFMREFVSNATHDLKTPLTVINTNTYLIRQQPDPQKRAIRLDKIEEEVIRLTRMIDDMLESARLDGGSNEPFHDLEFVPLLERCLNSLEARAKKKSITLALTIDPNAQTSIVYGAGNELSRVFTNLIENGIKYTQDNGSVTVSVRYQNEQAIIQIEDTGIGIEADEIDKVFDRFYRTANGRSHASGTGLGLGIVKLILDRHQGQVSVSSVQGEGSTFTVILPASQTNINRMIGGITTDSDG